MSVLQFSLAVGLVLGVVAAFGGFGAFFLVLAFTVIGGVVGVVLDGRVDLRSVLDRPADRR